VAWQTDDPAGDGPQTEEGRAAQLAARKRAARDDPANQNPARSNTNMGPTASSSRSSPSSSGSRMIVGLMGFAVAFSLVGNEIKVLNGTAAKGTGFVTEGGKIILGGAFATAILTLISHAGDGGRELATGLALVTLATSALVYGGPVWSALGKVFSNPTPAPTVPTGSTATTAATHPTS
jgi:hypothetical protein